MFIAGLSIIGLLAGASGLFLHVRADARPTKSESKKGAGNLGSKLSNDSPSSAFTPGNIVIYRVGDGLSALSSAATAVFLDEYTPAGSLVQSIAMPTSVNGQNNILTANGTSTSEGFVSRTEDGSFLVLGGYNKAPGQSTPSSDAPATTARVIGRVNASGSIDTTTSLNDPTGNIRGVASNDGTNLWLTSSSNGVRYAAFGTVGASTQISSTVTNVRVPAVFGGQLFVSTSSGATVRVGTVGSGLPTTSGQTITNLPGFPTTGAPYGYFLADLDSGVAGNDTLYVADDTPGTITKFSLVGGSWTSNGSVVLSTARGLTGSVNGSNVTLFATNGTSLQSLTDTTGYNATLTVTPTSLAVAPANTAFRGVAFAPAPSAVVTQKANVDMNGDGRSDFVVTRPEGTGLAAPDSASRIQGGVYSVRERMKLKQASAENLNAVSIGTHIDWFILDSLDLQFSYGSWGDIDLDTLVSADFDGDSKDDFAVWRQGLDSATTGFHWINSSLNTFEFDQFGQAGDDPTVIADYDGDGADDRAVFRCPPPGSEPGQCYFFTRSGLNTPPGFNFRPWGLGEGFSILPCPGDYDGDQTADLCIVREDPNNPGAAQFIIKRSSDGGVEFLNWGLVSDFIIPGDYDGDGKSDLCVMRPQGGYFLFYILERDGGGTGASPIYWGGSGDVVTPGDYNGDGKQDIAIWRPSDGNFWIRHSGSGDFRVMNWGGGFDYPVANWYVR